MWNKEVALSLVPLAVLNGLIIGSLFVFLALRALGIVKKEDYIEDHKHRATVVLGSTLREFWLWFTSPVERTLIALRVTPNLITTVGLLLSMVAGVFYYMGHVGTAGYMLILGACCDYFDGRVARATNRQTQSGAYYDAVLDRACEGAVLMGIAGYFQHTALVFIPMVALVGSFMVSYTKSKAEAMGVKCDLGLMQRPERLFRLASTSLFDPLVKSWAVNHGFPDVHYLMLGAVGVIAILTLYTTYQRISHSFHALEERDAEEAADVAPLERTAS